MSPQLLIRWLVAAVMLISAVSPALALAQTGDEAVVVSDNFDDPAAGILAEGSDDPNLRYDYDDGGYEIDAFADDFSGDLTVAVPGVFTDGTIGIDAALTGKNDGNGHYLFLACRVRDQTGYKLEIRPLAGVAALWLLGSGGNQRIANVGLEGAPGAGPFHIELSCEGDTITGRIDGQEVISATDRTYDQGSFAFGAGVYKVNAGKVSADFDNLTVSVPADETPATPAATPEAAPATPEAPVETPAPEITEEATPVETEVATAVPAATPSETPVSQAATFDRSGLAAAASQLRVQAEAQAPIFGPQSGETDLDTGVQVADFVAAAAFAVPDGGAWSAGYSFRQTGGPSGILQVSSNGAWLLTAGTEQVRAAGLVERLNTNPGDTNTVELIAAGEAGYLTVNGEFIAQLDLSTWPDAGNLTVIGTVADDGGPLQVFDVSVWALAGATSPLPVAESPVATPAVEPSAPATAEAASPEATVITQETAALTFADIVASVEGEKPLSGPDSGTLTQAIGSLDIASAGVITENFYSTVRFRNPDSAADPNHAWDIVLGFWHTGGDNQVRLVIASDGTWSLALGTARPILTGTVDNLNLGAGRGNDIELAVSNGVAYLGVNEQFVTSFEIPAQPSAGDLWLASGTFPENAQQGVETSYSDWTIWSLERG